MPVIFSRLLDQFFQSSDLKTRKLSVGFEYF